jgi:hypothetical protein
VTAKASSELPTSSSVAGSGISWRQVILAVPEYSQTWLPAAPLQVPPPDSKDQLIGPLATSPKGRLGGLARKIAELPAPPSDKPAAKFTLDVQRGCLHRRPARRDRRWKAGDDRSSGAASWIRPLADSWQLELSASIARALREAMPDRARSLQAAWQAVCPDETFEHWVNTRLAATPGLGRLTSPCLAKAQRSCAFEAVPDHALARLISANSQTVLPSPCSYGSFTGAKVQAALGPPFARLATWVAAESFAMANAAGSEMDVDSQRFRAAIASLRHQVEVAAAANDWTRHHNLLTALCVISLLACTGARPVDSPFQSLAWFNFEEGLVYIDDKFGQAQHSSRLCIMASSVVALMRDVYLPHLRHVADTLAKTLPAVSRAIHEVLRGSSSAQIPLFFFVRAWPEFDWTEVTELSLSQQCGPDWPLPWNFARHRLATGLRRAALDPEIIDALLGHGEAGSESHGAHSLRVLRQDLERSRPHVEALTSELALQAPRPWFAREVSFAQEPTRPVLDPTRLYGAEARRKRREYAHEQASVKAREDINRALNGRPPHALSPADWEAIGRQMLLRADGLPQPFASLRYEAYETFLHQLWHEKGVRPRMRRRFTVPAAAKPLVNELAVRANEQVATLRNEFEEAVARTGAELVDPKLARALAAIDICLNARLADRAVLTAIVQRPAVVPVRHQGQWYIEVFEGSHWSDGMPLRRFAVSPRSVNWMLVGSKLSRQMQKPMPIPAALSGLAAHCGASVGTMPALLKHMGRLVDQFNILSLSGFDAAVLAGRIKLSALPHGALVRTNEGQALLRSPALSSEVKQLPAEAGVADGYTNRRPDAAKTPEACRDLLRAIGEVLSSSTERSAKATEIERLLKESPFINGDLPHALGLWILHVLGRKSKTHSDVLKLPTVERYFNALASKVSAVGHDVHLVDMDGDELTDLYYDLLQAPYLQSVARARKTRSQASERGPETCDEQEEPDGDGYAADRLVEFHDFAQMLYGLEDPDWSELGEFSDRPTGRPGVITTREYLGSIASLIGERAHRETPEHLLECAWVLFLGFRFGLRGGEAIGLHRDDWIERAGATVVLVRTNPTRGLKTVRGKRVVPLIESLTDAERSVVEEVMRRLEARPTGASDPAILSNLNAESYKYRRLQVTGRLLRLLKLTTLDDTSMLHHARHSFANRIFARLTGRTCGLGSEGQNDVTSCESTRRLLLGRLEVDRRAVWALCRLMGHSSPATLVKSYLHVQVVVSVHQAYHVAVSSHAGSRYVDLDAQRRDLEYLKNLPAPAAQQSCTLPAPNLATLLNYLRLRRIGRSRANAAWVVGIEPEFGLRLEDTLSACALRLERVHKDDPPLRSGLEMLERIRNGLFGSLIVTASNVPNPTVPWDRFEGIESTIGRSRQIVLFQRPHFTSAAAFINHFRATAKDLTLVRPAKLSVELLLQIEQNKLDRLVPKAAKDARPPQVDTALVLRAGDLSPTEYSQRVGLKVAGDAGLFGTGYALIMAWCCFCHLEPPTARPSQST